MDKVFFAKMNNSEEIADKSFSSKEEHWFNGIQIGDYAFIKPEKQNIVELWKAEQFIREGNNKTLRFKFIMSFDNGGINITNQFCSLDLFKLDVNLLNKIIKPMKGICFYELKLTENALDIIKNETLFKEYIKDENHYRKIKIYKSKEQVVPNSIDVQLYLENGLYKLYPSNFIDKLTILDKFDSNNFFKGVNAGHTKGKLYKIIEDGSMEISRNDASLMGFYDLFVSSNDTSANTRLDFITWCQRNGVTNSSKQYEHGLRAIEKTFNTNIDDEFETDKCRILLNQITNDERVLKSKRESKGNQRNWVSYLKKYIEYKNSNSINLNDDALDKQKHLNDKLEAYLHANTLFYGVPGCGKSHYVKNLLNYSNGQSIDEKFYKRILFHPDYTYSDFVGQIMPESDGDKVSYNFQAGPFVEILKDTLLDENDNQYFLIIEEINRGNAPAIFGDIFQLLDRSNGESEYKIYNKEIINWLKKHGVKNISQLYIPKNLTIFATMNTSDQNVFTIDTAFKRRWRMHRIENNFENPENPILMSDLTLNNRNIRWKDFALALNKDIVDNCNDGTIAEDKLLGTNFIKQSELNDLQQFAEKIFMYLWTDVVKYNKEQLFKPNYKLLDDVIKDFIAGKNVFNDNCTNMRKLYDLENHSLMENNNE